jgi:co-chaperonin GroES (HSP10)
MARFSKRLIVVGDRVLVRPQEGEERTHSGLVVPSTAVSTRSVRGGKVEAVGPGVPVPDPSEVAEEPWRRRREGEGGRYVPLQARVGDFALFLRAAAVEITYEGEDFLIVPNSAILVLLREEIDLGSLEDGPRES